MDPSLPHTSHLTPHTYLQVVQLTVGARRDVEAGDVEDDLLSVSSEDPPLTLVSFLERLRISSGGCRVEGGILRRAKLSRGLLQWKIFKVL